MALVMVIRTLMDRNTFSPVVSSARMTNTMCESRRSTHIMVVITRPATALPRGATLNEMETKAPPKIALLMQGRMY